MSLVDPSQNNEQEGVIGEDERRYTILDETPDNYLILWEDDETEMVKKNPTNQLLYEEGLWEFLEGGEERIKILSNDPYVAIAPTSESDIYNIWFNTPNNPVLTDGSRSEEVLEALLECLQEDNVRPLEKEYMRVFNRQASSHVLNKLLANFPNTEATEYGWRIEDTFLVTWEGEIYRNHEEIDKTTFVRDGNQVTLASESHQLLDLDMSVYLDETINVEGMGSFGEGEIEFLATVMWLLKRREYFDDETYWSSFEE